MFTLAKAETIAVGLGGDAPSVLAVSEVESGGRKDLPDGRPQILLEALWFHNKTGGRWDASHPAVSSSFWNQALYRGGAAEYDRLAEASALDETAALESTSWGLFQIMGFNYAAAGFPTVQAYVAAIKGDDDADMAAFTAFVKSNPAMLQAFRAHDDRTFALLYNGPGQVDYYAAQIAAARDRHLDAGAAAPAPTRRALASGMFGPDVEALQVALKVAGYLLTADGAFGPKTLAAVVAFQVMKGLKADGIAGDGTRTALGLDR